MGTLLSVIAEKFLRAQIHILYNKFQTITTGQETGPLFNILDSGLWEIFINYLLDLFIININRELTSEKRKVCLRE